MVWIWGPGSLSMLVFCLEADVSARVKMSAWLVCMCVRARVRALRVCVLCTVCMSV